MSSAYELYSKLAHIAELEYPDIVVSAELKADRLRIHFLDGSFLDVWFSQTIPGKYAFHWERRHVNGSVYRWDNAAHKSIQHIDTFPHHLHEGKQENVKSFKPKPSWENTFKAILNYVKEKLRKNSLQPREA